MSRLPQRFKFWLGSIKKMSYPMNLIDIGTMFSQEINNSEHTVAIQSTGTYDKTGTELYFNDILEDNTGSRGVLVWLYDRLGIASGEINNYHAIKSITEGELKTNYTKIGNIYENQELVKGCLFRKDMVFYAKHFIDRFTGKPHQITVEEVRHATNELVITWGRDNTETWDLSICEKAIENEDYYF